MSAIDPPVDVVQEWTFLAEEDPRHVAEMIVDYQERLRATDASWARLAKERDELREALIEWWNDPDNPPVLAAKIGRASRERTD